MAEADVTIDPLLARRVLLSLAVSYWAARSLWEWESARLLAGEENRVKRLKADK